MKTIYVAGPYSGATAWQREQNIQRAEAVTLRLWQSGVPAICVHSIARFFFGAVPEETAIEIDNELLRRCDAVQLVEGWSASRGTLAEIELAQSLGLRVFNPSEEQRCIDWARGEVFA